MANFPNVQRLLGPLEQHEIKRLAKAVLEQCTDEDFYDVVAAVAEETFDGKAELAEALGGER